MSTVILYTTPTCQWCGKTKEFLKQHKVKYVEVDVLEDRTAYDRVVGHTHQLSVTVVEIDGTWIVGFHPQAMLDAIKKGQEFPPPLASSTAPHYEPIAKKTGKKSKAKAKRDPLTKPNPSKIPPWKK